MVTMLSPLRLTVSLIASLLPLTGYSPTAQTSITPMVKIPTGPFFQGSDAKEREYGYRLDEIRGSQAARKYRWFDNETRKITSLPAYDIDENLVTNEHYQRFIEDTGHPSPTVDEKTWAAYNLVHPYKTVQRYLWQKKQFPHQRGQHPVVLVRKADAAAYCNWRGKREQRNLHLPSEVQWEKAARGKQGNYFPWGNKFDKNKLNSAAAGPYDTTSVNNYQQGVSPYGVYNMAGMVFEWTSSICKDKAGKSIVKGGSWDDYPGVTRSAARHCRPVELKHVLIGFRCASKMDP